MYMQRKRLFAMLFSLLIGLTILPTVSVFAMADRSERDCLSPEAVRLREEMRKAWIDHTIWTRMLHLADILSEGIVKQFPDQF
jgi:hypothetical protein